MFGRLKTLFSKPEPIPEVLDVALVMSEIKEKEKNGAIPLGQRIHAFNHASLEFSLDREITKNYRLTVFAGKERVFSFTIFAQQGNYEVLEEAINQAVAFIDGDRKIAGLPKNDVLKGFFYGY